MFHQSGVRSRALCLLSVFPLPSSAGPRLLLGLDGVHVEDLDRREGLLVVTISSPAAPTGCPSCGVIAVGRGRRRRVLHDVPGASLVRIVWRQRVWRRDDIGCAKNAFVG